MKKQKGYKSIPLSFNRKMVRASASVTRENNAFHSLTQVDVTEPRKKIRSFAEKTGEKLSFTAYIVTCLAHVLNDFPEFNSFIKGNRLVLLDDVTVNVLIERDIQEEKVPESVGIRQAHKKSLPEIHNEIRQAQKNTEEKLGSLSGMTWIRFIPGFLLKLFIRIANKNIGMAKKYGKVCVTAIGMHAKYPVWFIPHGTATVLLTVGGLTQKTIQDKDKSEVREILNLTVTFDHDLIDGAPAARFMKKLLDTISNGKIIDHR